MCASISHVFLYWLTERTFCGQEQENFLSCDMFNVPSDHSIKVWDVSPAIDGRTQQVRRPVSTLEKHKSYVSHVSCVRHIQENYADDDCHNHNLTVPCVAGCIFALRRYACFVGR